MVGFEFPLPYITIFQHNSTTLTKQLERWVILKFCEWNLGLIFNIRQIDFLYYRKFQTRQMYVLALRILISVARTSSLARLVQVAESGLRINQVGDCLDHLYIFRYWIKLTNMAHVMVNSDYLAFIEQAPSHSTTVSLMWAAHFTDPPECSSRSR